MAEEKTLEQALQENGSLIFLDGVQKKETRWLWYPYIPLGKVTILMGDPGEGKSTFALNLAAAVTRGMQFPETHKTATAPDYVLYQNAEDGLGDTVRPRLEKAGADLRLVMTINEMKENADMQSTMLYEIISKIRPKLVILDPLQAYLGDHVDMHRANEVRPVMRYLAMLADHFGCAIVLIGHMNKKGDLKSIYRGIGSIDLTAAARSVLLVGRDPSDPEHRVIFQVKNSLAPEGVPVSFRVDEAGVFTYEGEYDISIERLVNGGERRQSGRDRCGELLRGWLTQYGEMNAQEVFDLADSEGISKRVLYSAAKAIGVQMKRGRGNSSTWKLPS